jgi:hypothetical protein
VEEDLGSFNTPGRETCYLGRVEQVFETIKGLEFSVVLTISGMGMGAGVNIV